jgi:hypothetical protein
MKKRKKKDTERNDSKEKMLQGDMDTAKHV